MNLVLAEGGAKGIKKFIRLMLHRIPWDKPTEEGPNDAVGEDLEADAVGDEPDEVGEGFAEGQFGLVASSSSQNRCDLLWQGVLPRKSFHAFRFQECRTSKAARKVLESKGIAHYWYF